MKALASLHAPSFVHAPSLVHAEWALPLAALWLALVAVTVLARLRAGRRLRRLLGPRPAGGRGRGGGEALLLAALLAIGLALLAPRIGTRNERIASSGVDVVILLDVSQSMDARDVPPSRIDRARQAAGRLLAGLGPGDRAALAAFAGAGVLLSPLSPDHEALAELLPAVDTSLVRPAASRLGAGVREALDAFEAASERPRVLVLLSDGEDPDGDPDLGLPRIQRAGVRVVAVAVGSEAGGPIPEDGLALRDRRGRTVITRLDASRLAALAEATDGVLLRGDAFGAVDEAALLAAVRRDAPPEGTRPGARDAGPDGGAVVLRRVAAVRIVPFALLAVLLLALEATAGGRRAAPVVLVALLALGAGPDPDALLERGLALAAEERWEEAERSFRAAALGARRPELAALAYHDAGVAALRAGRLEAARDAFLEAAALAPGDEAARFNLEWTLRALAAEEREPPPRPAGAPPPPRDERARPEPEPEPDADAGLPPDPDPRPGARPEAEPAEHAASLSPEEAERWLSRTRDDPARALRSLRGEEGEAGRWSPW